MLVVPIVSIGLTLLAYLTLGSMGVQGRMPEGGKVAIQMKSCESAVPILEERMTFVGLSNDGLTVAGDEITINTRLPEDERSKESIPLDLAHTGAFEVRPLVEGGPLDAPPILTEADIEYATVVHAFLAPPHVLVQLNKEAAKTLANHMETNFNDYLTLWVDGQRMTTRRNMPAEAEGKLEIHFTTDPENPEVSRSDLDQIYLAARTAMTLEHGPLPCGTEVISVTPLSAEPAPQAP